MKQKNMKVFKIHNWRVDLEETLDRSTVPVLFIIFCFLRLGEVCGVRLLGLTAGEAGRGHMHAVQQGARRGALPLDPHHSQHGHRLPGIAGSPWIT